jgi:hypothetical protein
MSVKALCRKAHVEKLDAGPKGVVITFRDNSFANPAGLVRYVTEQGPRAKVRPDMKIVFVRDLDLRLRDMNGNVIDQDVATDNFPVLGLQRQLCLNWAGSFQVEIIMYSGGGEFGVQAFATP